MNSPQLGEIYFLERPSLRRSVHRHPCLVLRVEGALATVNFISSEFQLFRPGKDLAVYEEWEEFKATGLEHSSFLIDGEAVQVQVTALKGLPLGRVEGALRKLVEDWWGEPL